MDLKILAAQLRKPDGETGHQVGELMNNGNKLINERAIEVLDLQEDDSVLEIGMGNGYFVKDILSKQAGIHYSGIDYSPLMVEEAIANNSNFIEDKKANFILGTAASLPFDNEAFTKILTINTIYFWDDGIKELEEIKRVLKPKGVFVIAIRSEETMKQMPFTEFGFIKYNEIGLAELLTKNGFKVVDIIQQTEPPYDLNGKQIVLQNIIISSTK